MKVLVTGSTGFIGRALCHQLLDGDNEVVGVSRSRHTRDLLSRGLLEAPGLARAIFGGDELTPDDDRALEHVDAIVHLAGDPTFGRGKHYREVNVEPTLRLADLAAARAPELKAFVFASSVGAQDRALSDRLQFPLTEASTCAPSSDYGRAKREAEESLLQRDLPVRIARLGMVVGAEMRPSSHISTLVSLIERVPRVLRAMLSRFDGALPIVHVQDAARALELLMLSTQADHGTFLVAADVLRVGDVVDLVVGRASEGSRRLRTHALAPLRRVLPFTLRSTLLPELNVDASRLRALGWSPLVTWHDAVREVADVVRARRSPAVEPPGWTVVTGAGSGLGAAMARRLSPIRPRLLLVDRDSDGLLATSAACGDARTLVADVTDDGFGDAIGTELATTQEAVAELFLCAGVGRKGTVGDVAPAQELLAIDVNLRARVGTVATFLPEMQARHFGRIVLISSSSAFQALPGFASYGASNAGLLTFGQAVAAELAGTGMQLLTVCPGGMDTNFQEKAGVRRPEGEKLLDPDRVAAETVDALERGRVLLIVGFRAKVMDLLGRLLPRRLQRRLWRQLVRSLR